MLEGTLGVVGDDLLLLLPEPVLVDLLLLLGGPGIGHIIQNITLVIVIVVDIVAGVIVVFSITTIVDITAIYWLSVI